MQVLWWLVPPATLTLLAMLWATWAGRERAGNRVRDPDAAAQHMQRALTRPMPTSVSRSGAPDSRRPLLRRFASPSKVARATPAPPSHGVVVRRPPGSA